MNHRTLKMSAAIAAVLLVHAGTPAAPPREAAFVFSPATKITEAFVPYDPPRKIFGFFRILENQKYDTWLFADRRRVPAKVYQTDFHGMFAFMIYTSDPDADVRAYELIAGRLRPLQLSVMDAAADHKTVFINTAVERKAYHQVVLVATSRHPERRFDFRIFGDPDAGYP